LKIDEEDLSSENKENRSSDEGGSKSLATHAVSVPQDSTTADQMEVSDFAYSFRE
jgi:hypothetical protein